MVTQLLIETKMTLQNKITQLKGSTSETIQASHHCDILITSSTDCTIEMAKHSECRLHIILIDDNDEHVKVRVIQSGDNSDLQISGLILGRKRYEKKVDLEVIHSHSKCVTTENVYCIVMNSSKIEFQGKIIVNKNTAGTIAKQNNKNIQLSEKAHIISKPILEIYSDDVTCSHGAVSGSIDNELIEYFTSRGIDEITAKDTIAHGYAVEITSKIPDHKLQESLMKKINMLTNHNEL